jgi:hypothetical protein
VNEFGFTLSLNGDIDIKNSGLTSADATANEGLISFEYGGTKSILMWFEDAASEVDEVLSDSYTQLVSSQPDSTFTLINQSTMPIDSVTAEYLTYVMANSNGESQGGGISSAWRCTPSQVASLTVTGSDAAVLQIRFKRILDGFTCS